MSHRLSWPAAGLFVLAPICAEYLVGYDNTTGRPLALLGGLLILGPLYGGAALIIREIARRGGRGWPTMIVLATAFGFVEAGLVDQSLFNTSFRDIEYWDGMLGPTYVPALGMGAATTLSFVAGHAIWSIGAPIAVVETFVAGRRTAPWLGWRGLAVVAALYLLASALIFQDVRKTEGVAASVPQLVGTAVTVVGLTCVGFAIGRRRRDAIDRTAPRPWLVGAAALVSASLFNVVTSTGWAGLAAGAATLIAMAVLVARWSRRRGWGAAHRLYLASGALLTYAWIGFTVEPLGHPSLARKLAHNTVFALATSALLALAARRERRTRGLDRLARAGAHRGEPCRGGREKQPLVIAHKRLDLRAGTAGKHLRRGEMHGVKGAQRMVRVSGGGRPDRGIDLYSVDAGKRRRHADERLRSGPPKRPWDLDLDERGRNQRRVLVGVEPVNEVGALRLGSDHLHDGRGVKIDHQRSSSRAAARSSATLMVGSPSTGGIGTGPAVCGAIARP